MAIQCMDLIFVNLNRYKNREPFILTPAGLSNIPEDLKTWNSDLIKFIGVNRFNSFKNLNKTWILNKSLSLQFLPVDLKQTYKFSYM